VNIKKDQTELEESTTEFQLSTFLPYLIRVFAVDVSTKISDTYVSDFDISPAEWRTLAIIGPESALSATQIVDRSSMDKVTVSRAVSKLTKRGWIKTAANDHDRRSKLLHLSKAGAKAHSEIVPRVQQAEAEMLKGLNSDDIEVFVNLMNKISRNCTPNS
jgi:DNA-binding MarR family transcriptional regulator